MADLYASRAPVRLNDGTADANNAGVTNAAPGSSDYALEVRQVGVGAAAALADATANPTVVTTASDISGYNGTTWDRIRASIAADATAATGLLATALLGYNGATWDRLRSTTANGLAVDVTRVQGTVTVDSELPAAAAEADGAANPTVPGVGGYLNVFGGTTWDRARSTTASDGNGALTTTGITAAGVGPGFARRFNPANLATASNSASAADVNGAGTATIGINTATTGTFIIEVSSDSTNWVSAVAFDLGASTFVTGTNLTPTVGKVYVVAVNGMRQVRLRTVSTLGATMAHTITLSLGDALELVAATTTQPVNLAQVGGSTIAIGQAAMAASLPVVIASNQSAITVDTELTAVAALADATANPTITNIASLGFVFNGTTWDRVRGAATLADALANPGTGLMQGQSFLMGYNGTTWDRVRTANTGRLQVDVITGAGGTQYVGDAAATATPTGTMAMGLANAAAPSDVSANNDAVAQWMLRNGSAVVNLASGGTLVTLGSKVSASSLPVVIASDQGAVTVDSELPAAASLADATANPTVPGVGAFAMGYNGTTWDRVRTANTGRLQVDVVTGGGSPPASGVPSGYNLIGLYGTSSAVAGGATQTAVVTNTPANTKTFFVRTARVVASGQTKWQVKFGATVLDTGFNPQTLLSQTVFYDPPLSGTGDGSTALTIDVTNREASAMDVYAALRGWVLQ